MGGFFGEEETLDIRLDQSLAQQKSHEQGDELYECLVGSQESEMSCGNSRRDAGPTTDMEIPKNQRQRDADREDEELNDIGENYRTHSADRGVDDHDAAAYENTVDLRDVQKNVEDIADGPHLRTEYTCTEDYG